MIRNWISHRGGIMKEDSFSKKIQDIHRKIGDTIETALRKYVHLMVSSRVVIDKNIEGRTQGIINEIVSVKKNKKFLHNCNEFFVKSAKDTDLCTVIGTGAMYINRMNMSRFTDGEIAFIVGHELGHVALRHFEAESNMEKACKNEPDLLQSYKRVQEHECDMFGVYFATSIGVKFPECMSAIRKLTDEKSGVIDNYRFWEDHPTAAERTEFLRKYYSEYKVEDIFEHSLSHELRTMDTENIIDVMGVTKEMRRQSEEVRKDNLHMFSAMSRAKEKIGEHPIRSALQYYLDTKAILKSIEKAKKNSYVMQYHRDEINDAFRIATAILKLPEIQKVKSKGLLRSTVSATFERKQNGMHR